LAISLHWKIAVRKWWAVSDLNAGPSGCKPDALTAELTAHGLSILLAIPLVRLKFFEKRHARQRQQYE
jgi:hypothetical protein